MRFTTAAVTMQQLSQTAMEEASRLGLREADLDHLFAALVISDQRAGRALRSLGLSLDGVRDAIANLRRSHLDTLGISMPDATPQRIVFPETRGYEWAPRAMSVLSGSKGRPAGDADSVLRALLAEPSGSIDELLAQLNVTSDDVRRALDAESPTPATRARTAPTSAARRAATAAAEVFVPAPVDDVWQLLDDVRRHPEWNPAVGSVERHEGEAEDAWIVVVPATHADGRPTRVAAERQRRRLRLRVREQPSAIAWRFEHVDLAQALPQDLRVELHETLGGSQLRLTLSAPRRSGWRGVVGLPLRPAHRFLLWITVTQMAAGISRRFR